MSQIKGDYRRTLSDTGTAARRGFCRSTLTASYGNRAASDAGRFATVGFRPADLALVVRIYLELSYLRGRIARAAGSPVCRRDRAGAQQTAQQRTGLVERG